MTYQLHMNTLLLFMRRTMKTYWIRIQATRRRALAKYLCIQAEFVEKAGALKALDYASTRN